MDPEVEEQLSKNGKDPHYFGVEKTLYKHQEQLLEVTDLFTCLWSDQMEKADNLVVPEGLVQVAQAINI